MKKNATLDDVHSSLWIDVESLFHRILKCALKTVHIVFTIPKLKPKRSPANWLCFLPSKQRRSQPHIDVHSATRMLESQDSITLQWHRILLETFVELVAELNSSVPEKLLSFVNGYLDVELAKQVALENGCRCVVLDL